MITYQKGNIFTVKKGIIAHGCNCVGGFGSGIAGQIAKLYPVVKKEYLIKHFKKEWKLGDIQSVSINPELTIINCATQYKYYPRNIVHADYPAIKQCFEQIYKLAKENNLEVYIPKIGAGLAGGDWTVIEKIINDIFTDYPITVFTLD